MKIFDFDQVKRLLYSGTDVISFLVKPKYFFFLNQNPFYTNFRQIPSTELNLCLYWQMEQINKLQTGSEQFIRLMFFRSWAVGCGSAPTGKTFIDKTTIPRPLQSSQKKRKGKNPRPITMPQKLSTTANTIDFLFVYCIYSLRQVVRQHHGSERSEARDNLTT